MCFLKVTNSKIIILHQAQEIGRILVCVFFFLVVADAIGFVCFLLLFLFLLEAKVIKENVIYNVWFGVVQSDAMIATP